MMFLKILMLIRQVYLKIVWFAKIDKEFRFQPGVCNGCHDVLMMYFFLNSIVILNIYGVDYQSIISGINKSEALNLFKNVDLSGKSGAL